MKLTKNSPLPCLKSLIRHSLTVPAPRPSSSTTPLFSPLQSRGEKEAATISPVANTGRNSKSFPDTVSKVLPGRWTELCPEASSGTASSSYTPSSTGSALHLSNSGRGTLTIQVLVTPAVLPPARSLLIRIFYKPFVRMF